MERDRTTMLPSHTGMDEAFELLMQWIGRIMDSEENAKLNLKMLRFMDEVKNE